MTTRAFNAGAAPPAAERQIDPLQPAREAAALMADPVFWGWGVSRGDGHTVIALPGLGGSDEYLRLMRSWLRRVGYRTVHSGLNPNRGWSPEAVEQVAALAEREAAATGRPVTLIGHSMGGLIARSVAKRSPAAVRQVITLAAPLAMAQGSLPTSVPLTALYSRTDPIVRHPSAVAREASATNIEVSGSHIGMATNREVYRHLGRLLASPARAKAKAQYI